MSCRVDREARTARPALHLVDEVRQLRLPLREPRIVRVTVAVELDAPGEQCPDRLRGRGEGGDDLVVELCERVGSRHLLSESTGSHDPGKLMWRVPMGPRSSAA